MDNNFKIDLKGITPIKSSFQKQPTVQSDVQYDETRNIDNAEDPAEFLGRSQVSFRHKNFISHDELKQKILDIIQDYVDTETAKSNMINYENIAEKITENCKTNGLINTETSDNILKILEYLKTNPQSSGNQRAGTELLYMHEIAKTLKNSKEKDTLVQFAKLLINNEKYNNFHIDTALERLNDLINYGLKQEEKEEIFHVAQKANDNFIPNYLYYFPQCSDDDTPEKLLYTQIMSELYEQKMNLFDSKYWDQTNFEYKLSNLPDKIIEKTLEKFKQKNKGIKFAGIEHFKQNPYLFLNIALIKKENDSSSFYWSSEQGKIFEINENQHGFIEKLLEVFNNKKGKDPELSNLVEELASCGVHITKEDLLKDTEEFLYRLYELQKKSPQIVAKIIAQLKSMPNIDYGNSSIRKNSKETIVCNSLLKNGEINASLFDKLSKIKEPEYFQIKNLQYILSSLEYQVRKTESLETDEQIIKRMLETEFGINIDYLIEKEKNKNKTALDITQDSQRIFETALKNCDSALMKADISGGIDLKYTRNEFVKDINKLLENHNDTDKDKILNAYGLTLKNNEIEGIPHKIKSTPPKEMQQINERMNHLIDKFITNNEVSHNDPSTRKFFNALVKNFPEFNMLIGKIDKNGERIDIKTLKTLKTLISNNQYKELSDKNKFIAKFIILLNSMNEIDSNPEISENWFSIPIDYVFIPMCNYYKKITTITKDIINRANISKSDAQKIRNIQRYMGWSNEYFNGQVGEKFIRKNGFQGYPSVNNAQRMAVITQNGDEELEISKLIEDTINPNNNINIAEIKEAQKLLYRNYQVLCTPTEKELEPYWETKIINGEEFKVIDLTKVKLPNDMYFLGHFADLKRRLNGFVSASVFSPEKIKTFNGRKSGYILKPKNKNIAQTSYRNIESEHGKNEVHFIEYLASTTSKTVKEFVKHELNLSEEEYGLLMEQIVDIESFEDLKEKYIVNEKTLSKENIKDAHLKGYQNLIDKDPNEHNETTIFAPEIIAQICTVNNFPPNNIMGPKKFILIPDD